MSEADLHSALAAMGIDGAIRAHGAVAVLLTANPEQLADPGTRAGAIRLATQHGFRALAVEYSEADAPRHTDRSDLQGADVHRA